MKLFSKILCAILALMLAVSLAGCNEIDHGDNFEEATDYSYVEGYYSELAYETVTDNVTTELIYLLCTDEKFENAVGKKVINFDSEGNMIKYTITIGVVRVEQLITFSQNGDSSYYSDILFDENEKMTSATWENITKDSETGDIVKSIGTQEYFENGSVKTYHEEKYVKDSLKETIDREYNESGELVKETIK